jgi:transposase
MAAAQCISRLGAWEGYEVESEEEIHRQGVSWCVIRLKPMTPALRCCSSCGEWVESIHDLQERRVRDLPIFEVPVELIVPRVRLLCPHCGPKLEQLSWLEPYARVTVRLAASVARLCKLMSIRHTAQFYGLAWTTVKRIDKRHLERELGPVDLTGVRVIAMDEFAIHKGHRYATVIVEPYRKRVLWLGLGRGRKDVRPFFELLGVAGRAALEAVAMDMNEGYAQEVRASARRPRSCTTSSMSSPSAGAKSSTGSAWMRPTGCAMTSPPASWSSPHAGCWLATPRTSPEPKTRSDCANCWPTTAPCSPCT